MVFVLLLKLAIAVQILVYFLIFIDTLVQILLSKDVPPCLEKGCPIDLTAVEVSFLPTLSSNSCGVL